MHRLQRLFSAATAACLLSAAAAHAADPGVNCEAGKLKVAAKYSSCRLGAVSKAVKTATTADFDKCNFSYASKWPVVELKGEGMCPGGEGDETPIRSFLDACNDAVADALSGDPLLIDVATCNTDLSTCSGDLMTCEGDLATCDADLASCEAEVASMPLITGQTTCYTSAGALVPCGGTGQDGELQEGAARSFTNNGNGTITDHTTGLMWEVLSDDGSIHDQDSTYTVASAYSVKIATLNGDTFAGHDDWRLPNVRELQTIVDFGALNPSVPAEFHSSCMPGCAVSACSCTPPTFTWSSTTILVDPSQAWLVGFGAGQTAGDFKSQSYRVRAVRSVN